MYEREADSGTLATEVPPEEQSLLFWFCLLRRVMVGLGDGLGAGLTEDCRLS